MGSGTASDGLSSACLPLGAYRHFRRPRRSNRFTYLDALQRQLKVMDSTAFSLCMDNKMPIIVFDLFRPHNLKRVVLGEKVGTLVTN